LNLNIHILVMFLTQRPERWYRLFRMITDTISTFLYVNKRLLSTGQQERNTEFTNGKRMRRTVLNIRVSVSWATVVGQALQ